MRTGDIRAVEFTPSREGDSPFVGNTVPRTVFLSSSLPDLMDQIPTDQEIGTVTGDGGYDTHRCHAAILERGGVARIPIRRNGRLWKEDCLAARARNDPPGDPPLGENHLEALVRLSGPKPDRGEDALAGSLEPVALVGSAQILR